MNGGAQRQPTCFSTSSPRFNSQHYLNYFRRKSIPVAEVNHWLEEKSGQQLEYVHRSHLVLASGKPVLQKSYNGLKYRSGSQILNLLLLIVQVRRLQRAVVDALREPPVRLIHRRPDDGERRLQQVRDLLPLRLLTDLHFAFCTVFRIAWKQERNFLTQSVLPQSPLVLSLHFYDSLFAYSVVVHLLDGPGKGHF